MPKISRISRGSIIKASCGFLKSRRMKEAYGRNALTVKEAMYYLVPSKHEHVYVNTFGIGVGLLALPVFALMNMFVGDLAHSPGMLWYGGKFVASAAVAGSAVLLLLIALRFLRLRYALMLALA